MSSNYISLFNENSIVTDTLSTQTIEADIITEYTPGLGVTVDGYNISNTFTNHEHALSTGLYNGGILSAGSGIRDFNISSGAGVIVQNTTNPHTITPITWNAFVDVAITNIFTQLMTFVSIDGSGNVLQSDTRPTNEECRSQIYLGVVLHIDMSVVTGFNQQQQFINAPSLQLRDVLEALGPILNIDGNTIVGNALSLTFTKSTGIILAYGSNFHNNPSDPHKLSLPAYDSALTALQYRLSDGTTYNTYSVPGLIDPDNYESGGIRVAVPTNKYTVQRVYVDTDNNIKIQYGQTIYNNMGVAKDSFQIDAFITEPQIKQNAVLIAYVIVRQGTVDLTIAADCFIIYAGKFEGTASSVGGSTIQNSYDNSISPQILTDSTRGALTIKRGSAADTDNVFETADGSGNIKFNIKGDGIINTSYSAGIGHFDASGLLSSSPVIDSDISGIISASKLALSGQIFASYINSSGASSNQVLTADGSGISSWSNPTSTNVILSTGTAATNYITFSEGISGSQQIKTDADLMYNATTNVLSAGTFVGSLSGNATSATTATTATSATTATTATTADNVAVTHTISGPTWNLALVGISGGPSTPIHTTYNVSVNAVQGRISALTLSCSSLYGSLSGSINSGTLATTQALNTNDTRIATTEFTQTALTNIFGTQKFPISSAQCYILSGIANDTRMFITGEGNPRGLSGAVRAPTMFTLNTSDYPTSIGTLTPKLKLSAITMINNHSASGSLTYSVRRIATISGTANTMAYGLNNHLSGLNIVITPLDANTISTNSTTLSLSGASPSGIYCFVVANSNTIPSNSCLNLGVDLSVVYT